MPRRPVLLSHWQFFLSRFHAQGLLGGILRDDIRFTVGPKQNTICRLHCPMFGIKDTCSRPLLSLTGWQNYVAELILLDPRVWKCGNGVQGMLETYLTALLAPCERGKLCEIVESCNIRHR